MPAGGVSAAPNWRINIKRQTMPATAAVPADRLKGLKFSERRGVINRRARARPFRTFRGSRRKSAAAPSRQRAAAVSHGRIFIGTFGNDKSIAL
jgi:hypothetical protein